GTSARTRGAGRNGVRHRSRHRFPVRGGRDLGCDPFGRTAAHPERDQRRRLTHYRSIRLSSSNARKPNTFLTSLGPRRFRNVTRLTSQVHETDISAKTVGETIFSSSDPEDNDCVTWRRTCFLP